MKKLKNLNIAILLVLLVFQTILSPISVFANETDPLANLEQPEQVANVGEEEVTTETPVEPIADAGEGEVTPQEDPSEPVANACTTIPVTLNDFKLTLDGTVVEASHTGGFPKELPKNTEGLAEFKFAANTDENSGGCNVPGATFTFKLPPSILEFTNGSFNQSGIEKNGVKFSYTFDKVTRLVTVTLDEITDPITGTGSSVLFEIKFKSFFNFDGKGDDLTHGVVIPGANGGSYTVPITFIPEVSGKPVTKVATTDVVIDASTGERTIGWKAWVNRDGKNLDNAKIVDTMTYNSGSGNDINGGHELKPVITVTEYKMGLTGPIMDNPVSVKTYNSFGDIPALKGKNAYELTYTTKVNLPSDKQVGTITLKNEIALNDKNGSLIAKSGTISNSTTYGEPLAKSLDSSKTNSNYESNWYIDYNFNQATIPQIQAYIEDKLPGAHVIDTTSIEVYEVNVNNTGGFASLGDKVTKGSDPNQYTISNADSTFASATEGFKLQFNDDTSKAYRIFYKAKYGKEFYIENPGKTTSITNTVRSGTEITKTKTATHDLQEGILTKSKSIDFENKIITWTIEVKADNGPITGLELTDVFNDGAINGTHTLVNSKNEISTSENDISVSGMTVTSKILTGNTAGFVIKGDIEKGKTATITYNTKFTINTDGSPLEQGYGNTVTAEWDTKKYSLSKEASYVPGQDASTTKNGNKTGSYDYVAQRFNWKVVVNTNKVDINEAVLVDTIGAGHVLDGAITVKEYKISDPNDDDNGIVGADLAIGKYVLDTSNPSNGFTITFDKDMDRDIDGDGVQDKANNKTYVIQYQTKDSNNIIGIEHATDANPKYINEATFTTQGRTTTLGRPDIEVGNGNSLLVKTVEINTASTPYVSWILDVNKSLSSLGKTTVTDIPSDNLVVIKDSIELNEYQVNKDSGVSNGSTWVNANEVQDVTVEYLANGGFDLNFADLSKKGYQVRYKTLVLGQAGDDFNNQATIKFAGSDSTAGNQPVGDKEGEKFAYSLSDADFYPIKGDLVFIKVGVNPLTGVKQQQGLAGAEFELVKTVGGTDYKIATATSDENGYFEFKNVNYASYSVKEVKPPTGYKLAAKFNIVLKDVNDASLPANDKLARYEVVNDEKVDLTNACPDFKLTIKDINSQPVTSKEITLKDSNGNVKFKGTTDHEGKVTIPRTGTKAVQAGLYQVFDGEERLDEVTVKYGAGECQDEIQPIKNSCPVFTVTLNDKDGKPRPGVKVTLKDKSGKVITAPETTTDADGKFTIPSTTPGTAPGEEYELYEGKQYLGKVEVNYSAGNCETEIIQVAKCPIFTLILKDEDGNGRDNVTVTIKDEANNNITQTFAPSNNEGKIMIPDLEPGKYKVYEGTEKIGEFTVNTNCEAPIQLAPACPVFTITVKDEDGILPEDTKVTLTNKTTKETIETTVKAEGKVIVPSATPAGEYEVKITDSNKVIDDVKITYKNTPCEATVEKVRTCDIFTITVKGQDGNIKPNAKVIVEDSTGTKVPLATDTTDADGKIQLSQNQPPGEYTVYEQNADGTKGEEIGKVKVTYTGNCTDEVIKNACPAFTLTVINKDLLPVGAGVQVTIKDQAGTVVTTGTTDANGQIAFNDKSLLQQGSTYEVYNTLGQKLGDITVSYIDDVCGAAVKVPDNICPQFALTLQNVNGVARPGVTVVIKDVTGTTTIATATTDSNGVATIPYTIEAGKYQVYERVSQGASFVDTFLDTITVTDTCMALIKPSSGGGGWTPPPVDPENPGEPPVDPENPGEPPVDPENPGEPPVDPENPGEPPVDPENPNPGNPDPETPVDPENPGDNLGDNDGNNQGDNKGDGDSQGSIKDKEDKLPQTDGASQTATVLIGLLLVAISGTLLFVRRRKTA